MDLESRLPPSVPATVLGTPVLCSTLIPASYFAFLVLFSIYLFSSHYIKCIYVTHLNSLLEHGGVKIIEASK